MDAGSQGAGCRFLQRIDPGGGRLPALFQAQPARGGEQVAERSGLPPALPARPPGRRPGPPRRSRRRLPVRDAGAGLARADDAGHTDQPVTHISPKVVARLLLGSGAFLCVPAAIGVIVFAQASTVVDAFAAARPCETPSRAEQADCLSLFYGTIAEIASVARNTDEATIDLEDARVTARFSTPTSLQQGSAVVTEWWRGQLVALGPRGASPNIIAFQSPVQHLENDFLFLGLVIPAVSALLAGLLLLQAPMTTDELIATSIAKWPDPPRPVERVVAWRVAWGGLVNLAAFVIWVFLYVFPAMILVLVTNQPRYAPLLLVATFVVSFGLAEWFAAGYLSELVRTSQKRTVVVQKTQRGLGRSRNNTKIWYARNDGGVATQLLDPPWDGHVDEGDRLDVLAIPKSGEILRILSTPPAQAGAQE